MQKISFGDKFRIKKTIVSYKKKCGAKNRSLSFQEWIVTSLFSLSVHKSIETVINYQKSSKSGNWKKRGGGLRKAVICKKKVPFSKWQDAQGICTLNE